MRTTVVGLVALAAAALGASLGWSASSGAGWSARSTAERSAQDPPAAPDAGLRDELARLRDRLDLETESRMELAVRVAELTDAVAALRGADAEPRAASSEAARSAAPADPHDPAQAAGDFDAERLIAAGFAPERVETLRERVDAVELAQLDLRDRATREGWLGTPRYAREAGALRLERGAIRDESDEALYDWYLYTSGRPNRIVVEGVMGGSAADAAGLQPGDRVVRYADRAVFAPDELRTATLVGRRGEQVALEVMRNGEPLRVFVPRGPLGIRLGMRSVEPPPGDGR